MSAAPATPGPGAYADVNGLRLYHEVHGETGSPLVLLHGGLLNIEIAYRALIPRLARRHRVIAVELQGHGRTADIDRDITPAHSAADVVALVDHLGLHRVHVLGHSHGGGAAMELAVSHPDRVLSVVGASVTVRPDGVHGDLTDPARHATSERMPTAEDFRAMSETYARLSPHPEHFEDFMTTLSSSDADLRGWTDAQLAAIAAPVLFVIGDRDFTTVEHAALMHSLAPGWPSCPAPPTCRSPGTPPCLPSSRRSSTEAIRPIRLAQVELTEPSADRDPITTP